MKYEETGIFSKEQERTIKKIEKSLNELTKDKSIMVMVSPDGYLRFYLRKEIENSHPGSVYDAGYKVDYKGGDIQLNGLLTQDTFIFNDDFIEE